MKTSKEDDYSNRSGKLNQFRGDWFKSFSRKNSTCADGSVPRAVASADVSVPRTVASADVSVPRAVASADVSVPRAVASEAPSISPSKASLATARGTDSEVVRTGRIFSGHARSARAPSEWVGLNARKVGRLLLIN